MKKSVEKKLKALKSSRKSCFFKKNPGKCVKMEVYKLFFSCKRLKVLKKHPKGHLTYSENLKCENKSCKSVRALKNSYFCKKKLGKNCHDAEVWGFKALKIWKKCCRGSFFHCRSSEV